jgi:hypothetical protein
MSITAFQVNGGLVTPLADRKLYSYLSNDDVGILTGTSTCENHQTYIRVTSGWGIIKGCVFRIIQEDIQITLPDTGDTYLGRLGIRLNLASDDPITFFQEFVPFGERFRDLDQQDINNGGQVYEFVLKQYNLTNSGVIDGPSSVWSRYQTPTVIGATGHYPVVNADPSGYPRVDLFFADANRVGNKPAYLAARAYDEEGDDGYCEDPNMEKPGYSKTIHPIIDEYGTFLPRIGELRGRADGKTDGGSVPSTTVANNTYKRIGTMTIPPGRWLINVSARFKKGSLTDTQTSTGHRQVFITASSPSNDVWSSAPTVINQFANTFVAPVKGGDVSANITATYENQTSEGKEIYVGAYQNCGASSAMTVEHVKNSVRLSDVDRWEPLGDVTETPVANDIASNG